MFKPSCFWVFVVFVGGMAAGQDAKKLPKDAIFEIKAAKETPVTALAFSKASKRIAVGYEDGTVALHDGETGKEIAKWNQHKHPVIALRFNRINKLLSGDADGAIAMVDGKEGKASRHDLFHVEPPNNFDPKRKEKVTAVAFDASGRAAAIARGRFDVKIDLLSVERNKVVQTLKGHEQQINTLTFSPDNRYLVSSGQDQRVVIWMPGSKLLPDQRKSEFTISFKAVPNQDMYQAADLATKRPIAAATIRAQGGDRVVLWYYKTGKYIDNGIFRIDQGSVLSMNPDGNSFAVSGSEGVVQVWPVPPVTPLRIFRGHGKEVSAVSFNHNGTSLASGDKFGRVIVWNAKGKSQK